MYRAFLDQLQIAFDASPNPILIVDPEGKILLTNAKLERLFEYGPGELVGSSVEVLVPDEVRGYHPELRGAFFRLPSTREMGSNRELHGVAKDGRRIRLEIGLNPMHTELGTIVLASIVDVTARQLQADKLRMAVDAASTAMVMIDHGGHIVLTNAQACEFFGYEASELLGAPVETLVPERLRRRHAVYRTSFVQQPRRRRMGEGTELFGLRKDGSEFPVEIGLTPIDAHDGHFIMATVQDVTERKRHEAEISARNAELARLNQDLSQFAYSASHELKAPLASIAGILGCAIEDLAEGALDELGRNVARARGLAEQLALRVENVLALARSEYQDEKWSPVSVARLLERLAPRVAEAARTKDVSISVDVRHRDPVFSEPTRLEQIVENLVENAVKYADPAKPERWVHICTEATATGFRLTVADNGIGIPADRHDQVFRMFRRFANHQEPGTGLGLALVQKHVDLLGGRIAFESSPAGTRFQIDLPERSTS
jgi:PAS domain S-box-containing protein